MDLLRRVANRLGLGRPARLILRGARGIMRRVRRAVSHLMKLVTRAIDRRAARRWERAIATELARPRVADVVVGTVDPRARLVVICLWNRPERVGEVLGIVAAQTGVGPIRLILWNNNPAHAASNRKHLSPSALTDMLTSIEYVDSPHNLMGMARFVAVRNAVLAGHEGLSFITLDDDEDVPSDFFARLVDRSGPTSVAGWWACLIHGTYWERTELIEDGAVANYVGTGGAIWPIAIVDDPQLIAGIPPRFRMIEDLWASSLALRKGWTLSKVAADVTFAYRDRDQGHVLHELKTDFYESLR